MEVEWRKSGEAEEYDILDVKKAYLQVKIAPELLRYQKSYGGGGRPL